MTETTDIKTTLFMLEKNRPARICGFIGGGDHDQTRLREIGFAEGDLVEILHIGAFGRSPLNIKLHGTSIAMRPNEARMIQVIPADLHRVMEKGVEDNNIAISEVEMPCCGSCGNET
ncbi:MAG: ferrous iron transport protein A [Robiginitomaculum sp.]|nr:ferrous iron transport protein A [Robiginitomaculum sp.]